MNSMERITAATLAQATAQQVFDQSVGGVIAQGRRCIDENGKCVYRKANGDACAAGQLLSDNEASRADQLGKKIGSVSVSWSMAICHGIAPSKHRILISYLQEAHDSSTDPDNFLTEFKNRAHDIAASFNINPSIIGR